MKCLRNMNKIGGENNSAKLETHDCNVELNTGECHGAPVYMMDAICAFM